MKRLFSALGIAAMLSVFSPAHAQVGLSAEMGTTGLGLHVSLPVTQSINARVGLNAFSHTFNGSTSDVDYNYKLKLQTVDVLADYFPISNSGFRLTGGLIYNGNKIDATGKPNGSGTYTINGNTYTSSSVGTLNGNVSFHKIAPYVGIGWGNALAKDSNWSFTTDIGVMYQGAASTSLSSSGCTASGSACGTLASDLAAENQKLQDKVNDYRIYPVIRVGLGFKF